MGHCASRTISEKNIVWFTPPPPAHRNVQLGHCPSKTLIVWVTPSPHMYRNFQLGHCPGRILSLWDIVPLGHCPSRFLPAGHCLPPPPVHRKFQHALSNLDITSERNCCTADAARALDSFVWMMCWRVLSLLWKLLTRQVRTHTPARTSCKPRS